MTFTIYFTKRKGSKEMSNLEKYQKIFMDLFQVEKEELNESFSFAGEERWDSVTHLSLIAELEDTFGIMFETDDILNYGSYLNGINILKKYGVEF